MASSVLANWALASTGSSAAMAAAAMIFFFTGNPFATG
jgi:hypothetical protein